ncbi:MAG: ribosome maturation factor RimP [Clostridiales bacterium]|nr:ribosome maturation factor RimP [Clostridiales bacterium]
MSQITDKVAEFVRPIIENNGMELVDVEFKKQYGQDTLTVFVDKEGGMDLIACEKIHNAISDPLDELDPTNGKAYVLNVSSPGLDRPFKTQRDYEKHLNQDVEISLYAPIEKLKKFEAKLLAYNVDSIDVEYKGKKINIDIKNIALIHEAIKF